MNVLLYYIRKNIGENKIRKNRYSISRFAAELAFCVVPVGTPLFAAKILIFFLAINNSIKFFVPAWAFDTPPCMQYDEPRRTLTTPSPPSPMPPTTRGAAKPPAPSSKSGGNTIMPTTHARIIVKSISGWLSDKLSFKVKVRTVGE